MVLPQWPAWFCLNGRHGSASVASMVLPQGSVRWFGGKLWSSKGPPCCPTAVLAALLHGATAAFSVEGAELGTVFLSGFSEEGAEL